MTHSQVTILSHFLSGYFIERNIADVLVIQAPLESRLPIWLKTPRFPRRDKGWDHDGIDTGRRITPKITDFTT
jgi:hypothetical protein